MVFGSELKLGINQHTQTPSFFLHGSGYKCALISSISGYPLYLLGYFYLRHFKTRHLLLGYDETPLPTGHRQFTPAGYSCLVSGPAQ
jgi:hypothetical protein